MALGCEMSKLQLLKCFITMKDFDMLLAILFACLMFATEDLHSYSQWRTKLNKLHVTCLTPNSIIGMKQIICPYIIQIGIIKTLCFHKRSFPPLAFSLSTLFPTSLSVCFSLCFLSFPFPFSFLSFVSCDKVILCNPN